MKISPVCVLIAICFVVQGSSETFRCYECDDCNVLEDNMLKTCSLSDGTTSPTTQNPTVTSTEPTNESSPESSTSSVTTIAPTATTLPTNPTEQSTSEISTTSEPPENSETTETIQQTVSPSTGDPEAPPAQSLPESPEPEVVDSYVQEPVLQPFQIVNRIPRHSRSLRSVLREESKSHHCYSIHILDGDSRKVNKGCVEVLENKSACDVLRNKFAESSVEKCTICSEDKCNGASMIKYSLITTLVIAFVLSLY